ncbi:hypothetical protein CTZ24_01470 [Pantoea phytobeneficialis]|uniref:Uncharacterized protein n=1 Tax=Pantoea phytobeneficialis TaxID=2052056 RepID=A0AAP9H236_9GAMM|nr:hypothetical protein CTZ24_01470 [Pantoea phytobeneficialis]
MRDKSRRYKWQHVTRSGAIYRAKKEAGAGPGIAKDAARRPLLGRRTGELKLHQPMANETRSVRTKPRSL